VSLPQPDLRGTDEPRCDPETGCITCGDVADPMRVVRIDADRELALCEDESGARHTVEIALVHPVAERDELLVHAGTAISNLSGSPA
jgi:hydrogenase maturation factor